MKHLLIFIMALIAALPMEARSTEGKIDAQNLQVAQVGKECIVSADLVLNELYLSRNDQVLVTPVLESETAGKSVQLPTIVFSGRNMHYVYLRNGETIATGEYNYNVIDEQLRRNGTPQTYAYRQTVAMQDWMRNADARLVFAYDNCGCGAFANRDLANAMDLDLDPTSRMVLALRTPSVTEMVIQKHEGRARVQFEVDRTELHTTPYVCKSGQRIDNRAQLQVIDDSVRYALSDPNVEIVAMHICGFASPESPYDHNDYLATNRSRSLAEYVSQRYHIPQERCTYSAVPENWSEFRQLVVDANDITSQQRADLLQLIDQTCYGPSDYDAKEKTLKTDPRFAKLYKSKILPVWFPQLRCSQFEIKTALKPMSDAQLCEVIKKTPQLLSLNQIYRVAKCYAIDSEDYNYAMKMALKYYAEDPIANLNAAVLAIQAEDFDTADKYLDKAGDCPEAVNARAVIALHNGDRDTAITLFKSVANVLPEAQRNLNILTK